METSNVYQIPADKYNNLLANALKQISEIKQPEWVSFVKTGVAKTKPSQEPDFWFKRTASILRQIYINNVVGVNRLKTRYGSKKNRGYKPERFRKASGKIIRVILQQAEAAGLLEKSNESGKRAGRKLTEKGIEFLENIKLSDKVEPTKPIDNLSKQKVVEGKQEATEDNKENKEESKLISPKEQSDEDEKQSENKQADIEDNKIQEDIEIKSGEQENAKIN